MSNRLLPPLLQTEQYAQTVYTDCPPGRHAPMPRRLAALRERQHRFWETPIPVTIILDEPVLLRAVGGRHTLNEQLCHLHDLASRDEVNLVITPLATAGGLLAQPCTLLTIPAHDHPHTGDGDSLVLLETPTGGGLSDDSDHIEYYRRQISTIRQIGLHGEAALNAVQQAMAEPGTDRHLSLIQ